MKPILCFGEIMARFSPPGYLRIAQAMPGMIETAFAGAEANVAVAVTQLGGKAEFISALPLNPIADAAVATLRTVGVGDRWLLRREEGRCGLYFIETGANHRGGAVFYDRDASTFMLTGPESYAWNEAVAQAGWFHTSGISASLSPLAAEAMMTGMRAARSAGVTVSFDLNFRRKLWRWAPGVAPAELARRTLTQATADADVLFGNPYDLADLIAEEFAGDGERVDIYAALAGRVATRFPHLRWIAMTLRQNHSASRNKWGALLFRPADGAWFVAPEKQGDYAPFVIDAIVDRVGTGDAFAGGLIFALQTPELAAPERALQFATAAGCIAHSIKGDFFHCSRAEVEALMNGDGAGHVSR